jgi:pyruvate-formate lyase-activating enzyme
MDPEALTILKDKLLSVGAPENELDQIIEDVNTIIIQRVVREYLLTVNDPQLKAMIETTSETDSEAQAKLAAYFKEKIATFPPLTQERYVEIAKQTWKEYFEYVS